MIDLAENDLQASALKALQERATMVRKGLDQLSERFAQQSRLLTETIDDNAAAMATLTSQLTASIQERERLAQTRFDASLKRVSAKVAAVAAAFIVLVVLMSVFVSQSIAEPLADLQKRMHAIIAGDYGWRVRGLYARDEIAEMARAVEVFRENAIAKQRAEEDLRAAKERAEVALVDLRDTQTSLIEAEKLAALGGLVAGVAHEVNNPVGISLTVASSLKMRCDEFAAEAEAGPMRRSRLIAFVDGNRDAAAQLVANLHRAGDLIQAFKQVAVDRSHADRRSFDLRESVEQIVSSLKPGMRKTRVALHVDVEEGIVMDSYPGPLGQVLTNLFLNTVTHGLPDGAPGTIGIVARRHGGGQVQILFSDDGVGMTEDVQRQAFEPFFTTRRGRGGTGLGLHIVYNIVTRRLGGRIYLSSLPGTGAVFRILLPIAAPREEPALPAVLTASLES